jgi:protein-tyrosine phosphatase
MSKHEKKSVLFLCTGNYFRSRFAEALFNHLANEAGLDWEAFSRGLAIHLVDGDLSPHTEEALHARRIDKKHTGSSRVQVSIDDFHKADMIIAVRDTEHRPMMRQLFPEWAPNITYWEVRDIDESDPQASLAIIEELIKELIHSLSAGSAHAHKAPR